MGERKSAAIGVPQLVEFKQLQPVRLCEKIDSCVMLCCAVSCCAVLCRSSAGAAELAVLFNRLANVCEPKVMTVKGLNTAKVGL